MFSDSFFAWRCCGFLSGVAGNSPPLWLILPTTVEAMVNNQHLAYGSFTYLVYGFPAVFGSILILRFANAIVQFTYRS